ncbi:DUF5675 family protein [Chryseobacterium sp.]|uniref:DUF5675 family protein n=1 Tax=Chryseobacterium sp. TaxID=1871047 RepID=UPI001E454F9C|nr:DUF5675 family protein [Chryseobacterium sp.]
MSKDKMELILNRKYFPHGTNGELFFNGNKICNTIELPWKANQRRVSCIPEGKYLIRKRFSVKYKWHLEVTGVKSRDAILFHPFNDALKESKGCIAPVTAITGEGKGRQSRLASERLKEILYPLLERGFVIRLIIQQST